MWKTTKFLIWSTTQFPIIHTGWSKSKGFYFRLQVWLLSLYHLFLYSVGFLYYVNQESRKIEKYGRVPAMAEILLCTLLAQLKSWVPTGQLPANTAYLSNLSAETNGTQCGQQHHSFTLETGNLWNKIKIVRIISFASQAEL